MALKCRGEKALGGLYTGINIRHIVKTSKMVFFIDFFATFDLYSSWLDHFYWTLLIGFYFSR